MVKNSGESEIFADLEIYQEILIYPCAIGLWRFHHFLKKSKMKTDHSCYSFNKCLLAKARTFHLNFILKMNANDCTLSEEYFRNDF